MLSPAGTVRATAPCRADLAGGTLDIWPLGLLHPGAVTVNVAIPVRVVLEVAATAPEGELIHRIPGGATTRLAATAAASDLTAAVAFTLRPEGGLEVVVREQAPVGSGLGGSSAYAVALASAVARVSGSDLPPSRLVALCRDLEARVLGVPTGCQDHWAAVSGEALALHPEPGGDRIERLGVDPGWVGDRMTVVFTGITHHSGMVNWRVVRRRLDRDAATVVAFEKIADAARRVRSGLVEGDHDGVAGGIRDEWAARRGLAPEVCPPELERVVDAASAAGAAAVKACGAGGGGSIVLWHRPGVRDEVAAAALGACHGGRVLATSVARDGLVVSGLTPR